jgi:hypothetical protein
MGDFIDFISEMKLPEDDIRTKAHSTRTTDKKELVENSPDPIRFTDVDIFLME